MARQSNHRLKWLTNWLGFLWMSPWQVDGVSGHHSASLCLGLAQTSSPDLNACTTPTFQVSVHARPHKRTSAMENHHFSSLNGGPHVHLHLNGAIHSTPRTVATIRVQLNHRPRASNILTRDSSERATKSDHSLILVRQPSPLEKRHNEAPTAARNASPHGASTGDTNATSPEPRSCSRSARTSSPRQRDGCECASSADTHKDDARQCEEHSTSGTCQLWSIHILSCVTTPLATRDLAMPVCFLVHGVVDYCFMTVSTGSNHTSPFSALPALLHPDIPQHLHPDRIWADASAADGV